MTPQLKLVLELKELGIARDYATFGDDKVYLNETLDDHDLHEFVYKDIIYEAMKGLSSYFFTLNFEINNNNYKISFLKVAIGREPKFELLSEGSNPDWDYDKTELEALTSFVELVKAGKIKRRP